MVRNSNFLDKSVYPYGYNSQNFNHTSLSIFLEIPKNLPYRVIHMKHMDKKNQICLKKKPRGGGLANLPKF